MDLGLSGKVALVTGSSRGIGRGVALALAAEGCDLVLTGRDQKALDEVAAAIHAKGRKAAVTALDLREDGAPANLIDAARRAFGQLDILVNNAGILRDKTLLKMDDAMFDVVVRVHLRGTFLCMQAAARHMAERGKGGRIINTSSVSGLMGNFGQANYSAAKAGIYGLTRTASMELKKYGITVNALAPVAVTRLTEDLPMIAALPNAKDLLAPEHIAPGALFLASDLAADVNGTVLAVEGPRMYLFKMIQTDAVTAKNGTEWTAQEIKERWAEIAGK